MLAEVLPEDKARQVKRLQEQGLIVAFAGDGINDAASLAQADVSLSFSSAADLARWSSDIILLGDDVIRIADALDIARRTRLVIMQNIAWALVYNTVAIPLAALGMLTPLIATLGMSASSLLVVANALRLARGDPRTATRERQAETLVDVLEGTASSR